MVIEYLTSLELDYILILTRIGNSQALRFKRWGNEHFAFVLFCGLGYCIF